MGYYDNYISHHQILGAKWGKRNGPPYPLGKGDHSAAQKEAAKKAGIKVGQDSGKGSIDNVKKTSKKSPLTEEEKRIKAQEAQLKGDKKNITKYMDKLSTNELQDAETRARIRSNLEKDKEDRSRKAIDEAIKSGDKAKVQEYATKMSYQELVEAMNKVDLMVQLNYVPPKPTTMDKIDAAMKKVDKAKNWMNTGLEAYDALAKLNNTFNKDSKWPRVEVKKDNKDDKDNKGKKNNDTTISKIINKASENKIRNEENKAREQALKIERDRVKNDKDAIKLQKQMMKKEKRR